MSLCLLLLMLFQGDAQPQLLQEEGRLRMALSRDVLEASELQRRLHSGLTTSLEFVTQVRVGDNTESYFSLLEIRYEIWEEELIVRRIEADERGRSATFKTMEELEAWMEDEPMVVGFHPENAEGSVRVQCRILPFSQSEGLETREWFSKVLSVPSAGQRGQKDRSRKRNLREGESSSGIFDVLMTTSIQRRSVRTYKWKWRLGKGS